MTDNSFHTTVESLIQGMDSFLSSKTVVGDAIHIGDTILLPLVDVSFGMGAGSFSGEKKRNCGGGIGGKISPSAVLVIQNGITKMVSVKNTDGISKLLDMLPDFVDKFMKQVQKKKDPEGVKDQEKAKEKAAEEMKTILNMEES